jgi:hypothetical protein
MTSENQIILLFANEIICQTRTKLFACNFIRELQNKLVLVCHIILLANYKIIWFSFVMDKREPNYFVILQ